MQTNGFHPHDATAYSHGPGPPPPRGVPSPPAIPAPAWEARERVPMPMPGVAGIRPPSPQKRKDKLLEQLPERDHNEPCEEWQQKHGADRVMCLACNKYCDGLHETTLAHEKKLEYWLQSKHAGKDFSAPSQPWLAFAKDPTYEDERGLKCLLCDTWVSDIVGICPEDYAGLHGCPSPENSNGHAKMMQRYRSDRDKLEEMLAEKAEHHPEMNHPP